MTNPMCRYISEAVHARVEAMQNASSMNSASQLLVALVSEDRAD